MFTLELYVNGIVLVCHSFNVHVYAKQCYRLVRFFTGTMQGQSLGSAVKFYMRFRQTGKQANKQTNKIKISLASQGVKGGNQARAPLAHVSGARARAHKHLLETVLLAELNVKLAWMQNCRYIITQ